MDLERNLHKFLKNDELYQETLQLVRKNSSGNIWLIGGYLSRNLANMLYGTGDPDKGDIDFIVEKLNGHFITPDWQVQLNDFGNPKLKKGDTTMDVVPLENIYSIKQRDLDSTIDNFLTGTPLTFQSIVYDTTSGKIIGDIGINSLITRTIGINHQEFAKTAAKIKKMTLDDYIEKYAQSFGFKRI